MSRKEDILAAALQCFTEHAIECTSIEMICEHSGASVGSIYHHFKNKQGVVAALFVKGIHDFHLGLNRRLSKVSSAEECVTTIVSSYLSWVAKNPDWARFLLYSRENIHDQQALQIIEDENTSINVKFMQYLKPHFDSGAIKKIPMEVYLALILGPVQTYARRWVSGKTDSKIILKYQSDFARSAWLSVKA